MKPCPRCEAEIDESARFCPQCAAPQSEEAAEELEEWVRNRIDVDGGGGSGDGGGGQTDAAGELAAVFREELNEREKLWRRGCYVVGYATLVVALTGITSPWAWPLIFAGIAILPPVRRATAIPLGSPFKREVMVGLYGIFLVLSLLLFLLQWLGIF